MKKILSFIVFVILLQACSVLPSSFSKGDFFYIVNDGVRMPVMVCGNTNSGVFLLFLAGGPGDSGIEYCNEDFFLSLESNYAVVYWDQRGFGASQRFQGVETNYVEKMVADTKMLIQTIGVLYQPKKTFLMTHSFGSLPCGGFLIDTNNQPGIAGWINLSGVDNYGLVIQAQRNSTMLFASNILTSNLTSSDQKQYWSNALTWFSTHTEIDKSNFIQLQDYAIKTTPSFYQMKPWKFTGGDLGTGIAYLFSSPENIISLMTSFSLFQQNFDIPLFQGMNLFSFNISAQLKRITVPSILIWGLYDTIPLAEQNDFFTNLGTAPADKFKYVISNSGHYTFTDQPEICAAYVKNFIEKYR